MKQKLLKKLSLRATMFVMMLVGGFMSLMAQNDYSAVFTSNVTLTTEGGSNLSEAKVVINGESFDAIKAGTNSKAGVMFIVAPAGTKYLHFHIAGWNGKAVKLSVLGNEGSVFMENYDLTSDTGIANNSPFTFAGDATSTDFYKVITFTQPLAGEMTLRLEATANFRFVIWGVNAELGGTVVNKVSKPAINGETPFYESTAVTISCGTSDATIEYSTDGGETWQPYTIPFRLLETTTVMARATKSGLDDSDIAEKTFTKLAPVSPAEALEANIGDVVFVAGVVSEIVTPFNASFGNISYMISDGEAEIQAYRGIGLYKEKFTSADDLLVGAEVVVAGTISEYNEVKQLAAGNYLLSYKAPEVVKQDPKIDVEDVTVSYGESFTLDAEKIEGGAITLTSSNPTVAEVNGLTIKSKSVGEATITVATAANALYYAGEETFEFEVLQPEGKTEGDASNAFKTEFINKDLEYVSGIDWTASIPANSFESQSPARGVQFGAAKGVFTITAKNSAKVTLVELWVSTNGEGNTVSVKVGDTDFIAKEYEDATTVTLKKENHYAVSFTGEASGDIVITINNVMKSVYIKSIGLVLAGSDDAIVTLNDKGFATYCSEYPLDLSAIKGGSAWQLITIKDNTAWFDQVYIPVIGGEGLLLEGEPNAEVTIPVKSSTTTLPNNLLIGTLAPTFSEDSEYLGLKGDKFFLVDEGVIPANKALIDADLVDYASVKEFQLVFNGITGVKTVKVSAQEFSEMFNLAGQRVNKNTKGVVISNGKKVIR
ncbi:MAG: chitobiase/beta-hexosaminidase C-terminal domain-containing protein [Bacteroidaceae bacterium]|nr:chitobiase/beta-hexosaminidase C-terminal domain-containing protein [Bacteroidaceae bacterium]